MMSSSDKTVHAQNDYDWQPLVPSELEKFEREVVSQPDIADPEVAKAFKALYEKSGEESQKTFSLLYGPRKELEKEKAVNSETDESGPETESEPVPQEPDLEAIREEAYAEAYAKGEIDGYQAGLEKAGVKTDHLAAILNDVEGMWNRMVNQYEANIVDLICRVTEKVVYGQVAVDKGIITRVIMGAFQKIADPVSATITVNPEDYEYIEAVKEDFFETIKGLKQVSLVSDPLVSIGGCRIETPSGEVETGLEERLEAVKQCLIENSR
jgi:flagellar assembly protein FliH